MKSKINIIWYLNIGLFIVSVVIGVMQAGKTAEVAYMDKEINAYQVKKREITENIFKYSKDDRVSSSGKDLGFTKASDIVYISNDSIMLTLR